MDQIDELHARFGRAGSLADYLRGLAAVGVTRFDSFLTDGHSEFLGAQGQRVVSPPYHQVLAINEVSNRAAFLDHLQRHLDGQTHVIDPVGTPDGTVTCGVSRQRTSCNSVCANLLVS